MCNMADYTSAGKCDLATFSASRREMFVVHLTLFAIVNKLGIAIHFAL